MSKAPAPSREQFLHFRKISTRWKDNDIYGHVNNVEYYSFFDTVINAWLIEQGGLDIHNGQTIGVCAESRCRFLASIAFPDEIEAGLRVGRLGNSSVRYEIGLFNPEGEALAEGYFVHVFVDRATRSPRPMPETIRASLQRLETSAA
ncbi:MAG TPA: thioesterase family protein [Solirubrobacterales bacterium]|nr:thioesterase family protein [Solirubrobacterales bacterium]